MFLYSYTCSVCNGKDVWTALSFFQQVPTLHIECCLDHFLMCQLKSKGNLMKIPNNNQTTHPNDTICSTTMSRSCMLEPFSLPRLTQHFNCCVSTAGLPVEQRCCKNKLSGGGINPSRDNIRSSHTTCEHKNEKNHTNTLHDCHCLDNVQIMICFS